MPAVDYQDYLKRFISDTFYPHHYAIVITSPGALAADADGFIDDLNAEGYAVDGSIDPTANPRATGSFPSTGVLALAKERANMRWEEVLIWLSTTIQPTRQYNVNAVGADHDTEATTMEVVIEYDRPEYLQTEDELNPGTFLFGEDAVTRFIARALVLDLKRNRLVYNPDLAANKSGPQVQGPIITLVEADKIFADIATAEASIAVTLLTQVSDTPL